MPADPGTVRRRPTLIGLAVVVTALIGLTGASSAANPQHSRVLRFDVRFSPLNIIDVPPSQSSPGDYRAGDYTVFSDTLTDASGRRVGTEAGTGTITRVGRAGAQIYYTMAIRVPGGQITASGLGTPAPGKHLAVTGGTGSFVGADGSVEVVENGDETGSLEITLR